LKLTSYILFFILTTLVGVFAFSQTEIQIGDQKSSSNFETKTCSWMYKQYLFNERKNLQTFIKSGGFLDCSREAVVARDKLEKEKLPPIKDLSGSAIMARWTYNTTSIKSLIISCYDKLEEHQRQQAQLFDDLVAAMRVRTSLYDVKYLLNDPRGRKLLLNQCKVYPSTTDHRNAGHTFTGHRLNHKQSDAEFIRDHSISCATTNQVEVRTSDFQRKLSKNYLGVETSKVLESSQIEQLAVADQIRSIYGNDADFEDRQTCQQVINKQDILNEANRIKPPVEKTVEADVKREKPDQCKQFERTFDCDRMAENKEVKIIVGWPMCAKEIAYDCVLRNGINARPSPNSPAQRDLSTIGR
jgi:hypothetical protein